MGYPKKMYFGTLKNRKMKTVLNDYDEQQLRSQGWVDFAQLGKGNDGSQSTEQSSAEQSSAECEELKQNYDQLQSNYKQLQIEHEQLKLTNVSLNERLQELNQQHAPPSHTNYETWTVKQLRDELAKYGITPSQDVRKSELIEQLIQMQSMSMIE